MERITLKKGINSKWRFHIINLHLVTFFTKIGPKMAENWPNLPIWRFELNLRLVKIKPPFRFPGRNIIKLSTFHIGGLNLFATQCTPYFFLKKMMVLHWWRDLFMRGTVHIRSYNVKSHWKVQGGTFSEKIALSTVYLHLSDCWAVSIQLDCWLRYVDCDIQWSELFVLRV